MAVSTTVNKIVYSGDGVQKIFPFNFALLLATDLQVILVDADGTEHLQVLGGGYTMTKVGPDYSNGGNVVMAVAPSSVQTLVLVRVMPLTQEMDYEEGDSFPAEEHERALDKLTMIGQQITELIGRQIAAPIVDNNPNMELPNATQRADHFLAFDSNGDVMATEGPASVPVSPAMAPVVEAATLEVAREELQLGGMRTLRQTWQHQGHGADRRIEPGDPIGIVNDKYVVPQLGGRGKNVASFTPTGVGTGGNWYRTHFMYEVISETDKAYPATKSLFLFVQRTSTSDLGACVFNLATDGARTQIGSGVTAGISNVGGSTQDLCVLRVDDSTYAVAYISSTGTLRLIALTWNEGTSTLAFAGDTQLSATATHQRILGLQFGRWRANPNKDCAFLVGYSSGTGSYIYQCRWGGSSWSNTNFDWATGKNIRNLHGSPEPYKGHNGYDIWAVAYTDDSTTIGYLHVHTFYLDVGMSGKIETNQGWIYRSTGSYTTLPEFMTMCKIGHETDGLWLLVYSDSLERGTYDQWMIKAVLLGWNVEYWDFKPGVVVELGVGRVENTGIGLAGVSNRSTQLNRNSVGLTWTIVASAGIVSQPVIQLYKGGLVMWNSETASFLFEESNGKGLCTAGYGAGSRFSPDFLGVAGTESLSDWDSVEVVLFGKIEGLTGLGSAVQRELHYLPMRPAVTDDANAFNSTWTPIELFSMGHGFKIGNVLSDTEMFVGL